MSSTRGQCWSKENENGYCTSSAKFRTSDVSRSQGIQRCFVRSEDMSRKERSRLLGLSIDSRIYLEIARQPSNFRFQHSLSIANRPGPLHFREWGYLRPQPMLQSPAAAANEFDDQSEPALQLYRNRKSVLDLFRGHREFGARTTIRQFGEGSKRSNEVRLRCRELSYCSRI